MILARYPELSALTTSHFTLCGTSFVLVLHTQFGTCQLPHISTLCQVGKCGKEVPAAQEASSPAEARLAALPTKGELFSLASCPSQSVAMVEVTALRSLFQAKATLEIWSSVTTTTPGRKQAGDPGHREGRDPESSGI